MIDGGSGMMMIINVVVMMAMLFSTISRRAKINQLVPFSFSKASSCAHCLNCMFFVNRKVSNKKEKSNYFSLSEKIKIKFCVISELSAVLDFIYIMALGFGFLHRASAGI